MHKLYVGVITITLGMLLGITAAHTAFAAGTAGWYTLFVRHECSPGENRDGGCFCNNPGDCQVTFTNDQRTNALILDDVIKSQGSGHFIPQNLAQLHSDLNNALVNNQFGNLFNQCVDLKTIRGININCDPLNTVQGPSGLAVGGQQNNQPQQPQNPTINVYPQPQQPVLPVPGNGNNNGGQGSHY